MQIILFPDQMRQLEQAHFARSGMPSHLLMGRAALELAHAMDERGLVRGKRMTFVCGNGGNGGDGLEAARLCQALGARCSVVLAAPRGSVRGDAVHYLNLLPDSIPIRALDEVSEPDVWVDALFGIGLSRDVTGLPAQCIERMNASPAPVVSVDIPSGLDGRTGDILGCAVRADVTVTFQHAKPGHYLRHGLDCCGELVIRDIGISDACLDDVTALRPGDPPTPNFLERCSDDYVAALLPRRRHFSHKTTYGHLLLVAGSVGMAGAAAIAAKAAIHSGAGLVTIACPEALVPILQIHAPEAMCLPMPQNEHGALDASAVPALERALRGKTAVAIGPGLSRSASPEIVRAVLRCDLPAVIDADALNLISADSSLKALLGARHLITPHPGEAARLIAATGDEVSDALTLAGLGCSVIYKGAVSLIAGDGQLILSDTGSPCMAKGGSGDMLTGIAGALLAQGLAPTNAGIVASHVHGHAGEAAERALGLRYPAAMDLIAQLPGVWQRLEA